MHHGTLSEKCVGGFRRGSTVVFSNNKLFNIIVGQNEILDTFIEMHTTPMGTRIKQLLLVTLRSTVSLKMNNLKNPKILNIFYI